MAAFAAALFIGLAGGVALAVLHRKSGRTDAFIALWLMWWACAVAGKWQEIEDTAANPLWLCLPIGAETLRRYLLSAATRILATWPIVFGIFYAMRAIGTQQADWWRIIPLTLAQSAIVFALGTHLAAFFSRRITGALIFLLTVAGIVPFFSAAIRDWIAGRESTFLAILPTGWAAHAVNGSSLREWLFVLPISVLLAAAPLSIGRLRKRFHGLQSWQNDAQGEMDELEIAQVEAIEKIMRPHGPTHIVETVRQRGLPAPEPAENRWLDRLIEQKLSDHERAITGFLWPFRRRWTAQFFWIARCQIILAVLTGVTARFLPGDWLGATLVLLLGWIVPLALTHDSSTAIGIRKHPTMDGSSPRFYTAFPIAYNDLYKTLSKVHFLRLLAWAPLFVVFASAVSHFIEQDLWGGALIGLRVILFSFAIQPMIVTYMLCDGSNLVRYGSLIVLVPLGLVVFFAGLAFLLGPLFLMFNLKVGLSLLALVIASKAIQLIFRALYRGRSLDLLNKANR